MVDSLAGSRLDASAALARQGPAGRFSEITVLGLPSLACRPAGLRDKGFAARTIMIWPVPDISRYE